MKAHDLPVRVEPMRLADIPDVMKVENTSFTLPWSANTFRYDLTENPNACYLVLRAQRRWLGKDAPPVLGYGGMWLLDDDAHVTTVAVLPAWRRHRLGEWLMLTMVKEARQRGAWNMTLEVRVSNAAAIALYRRLGFTVEGIRPEYYSDNHEDGYIMTLWNLHAPEVLQHLYHREQEVRAELRELASVSPSVL